MPFSFQAPFFKPLVHKIQWSLEFEQIPARFLLVKCHDNQSKVEKQEMAKKKPT